MRILVSTPTFFPIVGGAELLIDDVLSMLSDSNEVRMLTPRLPEKSRPFWVGGVGRTGYPYEVVEFEDRLSLLRLPGQAVLRGLIPPASVSALEVTHRHVRSFRPDVLVTFFGVPYGLSSLLVRAVDRVPLVLVLLGADLPSFRTAPHPLWPRYLRLATRHADRVVYVSRFCFDVLERRPFDPRHDFVIHGGVDPARLKAAGDPAELRARLGIGPDETMLFAIQRIGDEKRVDVLVDVVARLLSRGRRAKLVIAGQGTEEGVVSARVRDLGVEEHVVLTGHLGAEKAEYYEACDIVVFHSLFETFGQVLPEAMSFGKPIVSVRAGAIPEVAEDGRTALLVPPLDPDAFADAVERVMDDAVLRERMIAAGPEEVRRRFDWDARARAWRDVIAPGGSPRQAESARVERVGETS